MESLDRFVAAVDPALVVVTTAVDGERAGCLVGFHCQASIEPEQYATWISRLNRTVRLAARAEWLAVHYLDESQLDVAAHFGAQTGDDVDKFATIPWTPGPYGVPLLGACPDRLVLRRITTLDVPGADHLCVVSSVADGAFSSDAAGPLRLSDAANLSPGHEADDS